MKIALVDMDQTLCDYEGALKKKLKEMLPAGTYIGDVSNYDHPIIKDIKKTPGFWRTLPTLEIGFHIISMLRVHGYDIHILSKGPYNTTSAWTEKVEWCREHLPGVPVTITENKGLVYGKILVDDWPEYCEQWLKWRPRGLILMPAYPYNEGFNKKYPGQVIRVNDKNWKQVDKAIKNLKGV